MPISANGDNALHELGRAMTAGGHHSTAVALRKLAHEGYTTLAQVDRTPDWILLAIRGIGVGRLRQVRRLTRSDWRPPSSQVIQAGVWFLSAAQFALRHWPPDTLVSLIRGCAPEKVTGGLVEQRLALDVFSQAARKAQSYYESGELVQALWQAQGDPSGDFHRVCESTPASCVEPEATENKEAEAMASELPATPLEECNETRESDHYAYPRHERLRIVRHYRAARANREIVNKEHWAQTHYHISARTLLNYELEFMETETE